MKYTKQELREELSKGKRLFLMGGEVPNYFEKQIDSVEDQPRQDGEHGRATIAEIAERLNSISDRLKNLRNG